MTFSYMPQIGATASLTATVDVYNSVVESNKANNVLTSNTISVMGTGAALSLSFTNPHRLIRAFS